MFVVWMTLCEIRSFHHHVAIITGLTITECHRWSWTFSVCKIESFFCACTKSGECTVTSGVSILPPFEILILDFVTVLTVWYFLFFSLFHDRDLPPGMSTHRNDNIRYTTGVVSWAVITFSSEYEVGLEFNVSLYTIYDKIYCKS